MRMLVAGLLAIALLAIAVPRDAEAQGLDRRAHGWLTIDGFLSSYQIESLVDDSRRPLAGGGLRVMFSARTLTGLDAGFLERSALGAFLIYTPTRDNLRTWHFGGQVDHRLLGTPIGGLLDPLVSLGAGAIRMDSPSGPEIMGFDGEPTVSETFATLVPGIGARLRVARGVALRADVRNVIIFGNQTTNNWELAGGLSLLF